MFTLKNLARKELRVNHCNDELIFKKHKIDQHFLSLLDTAMAQVVELIPFEGQWVYIEYHGCWCPDDSRNKAISSIARNISFSASESLRVKIKLGI